MLKSPGLYGVGVDYQEDDNDLIQKRTDIVHSAAALLEKGHLVKYERSSGRFQSIELGRWRRITSTCDRQCRLWNCSECLRSRTSSSCCL